MGNTVVDSLTIPFLHNILAILKLSLKTLLANLEEVFPWYDKNSDILYRFKFIMTRIIVCH